MEKRYQLRNDTNIVMNRIMNHIVLVVVLVVVWFICSHSSDIGRSSASRAFIDNCAGPDLGIQDEPVNIGGNLIANIV